jgi:hypothetical protein
MKSIEVQNNWPIIEIDTIDEIFDRLALLKEKQWVFRGQGKHYQLLAPIDRGKLAHLDRIQKLWLEKQGIIKFQQTVEFFTDDIERKILSSNLSDPRTFQNKRISILMLMQHYYAPTRLLDWTSDPNVALYFAVTNYYEDHDDEDGEVWCFDGDRYNYEYGPAQWINNREVKDTEGKFDKEIPIIFTDKGPSREWFVMQALKPEFPRLKAQDGYFCVTSHFDRDHAIGIQKLFKNNTECYCRFTINKKIKSKLRDVLKENKYWQGTLFPDIAGVAGAIRKEMFDSDLLI